jgi:hypothetical protein
MAAVALGPEQPLVLVPTQRAGGETELGGEIGDGVGGVDDEELPGRCRRRAVAMRASATGKRRPGAKVRLLHYPADRLPFT